jgi:hypothetical protein
MLTREPVEAGGWRNDHRGVPEVDAVIRTLALVAAMVLFLIAALGAFGTLTGVNYAGLVAVGLACVAAGMIELGRAVTGRRR